VKPVVAIVAQGTMGAGLAKVLTDHGLRVLTTLAGRSAASNERAAAAGMQSVELEQLAQADLLLSVLPPAEAAGFARKMAGILAQSPHKPVFADCNAVSPATVQSIAKLIEDSGVTCVDVGIIGLPPRPGTTGPRMYASGAGARHLEELKAYGLDVRLLDGPVGNASALKMSYAGITKGMIAVATAMILGASRAGVADALHREMSESEAALLQSLSKRIPDMLPKAYRWVEEMRQIHDFVRPDAAAGLLYQGAAGLFKHIAEDRQADRAAARALTGFFAPPDR
jgi:3-hydroxyisobutyrate dehydrogenase-like beta-hydroxyacid dehydrogenase